MKNLLTIGSVAFDDIETPFGKVKKTLGGSAAYISLAASYFTKPEIVAVVGDDFKTKHCKIFQKQKINLSGLEMAKGKTFAWGGKYHFDLNTRETLFTHLNVFEHFSPYLSPAQTKSEYIFLGNTHPVQQIKIIKQLTKPKFIGLDTMNYWIEKTLPALKQVLKMVDVLIINDSEARELSKEHNIQKAAKKILGLMRKSQHKGLSFSKDSPLLPVLIIKRGEYGLLMFRNNNIFHLPGYPLENVMDPTGAGDSFAGGFMGHLAKTDDLSWKNLKKACVFGSIMASFCVEKFGTLPLQNLKPATILNRYKNFKSLTHFEI